MKPLEDVQDFIADMNANFAMNDECEKIKNERSNKWNGVSFPL